MVPKHVPKTKPKQIKTTVIPKPTSNKIRLPNQIKPIMEGGGNYVEDSSFSEVCRFSNFDSFKQSFDIWCKKHYHPMKIRNSQKSDNVNTEATNKVGMHVFHINEIVMYACKH